MVKLLLLCGAFQGFLLCILLFAKKVNTKANKILALLLLILSLHIILVAFDERSFFMKFPHLSHISWLTPNLLGPLVLIYVKRITGTSKSFSYRELFYFIPFTLWLALLSPYYLKSSEFKRAYLNDYVASVRDDFGPLNEVSNYLLLLFFGLAILEYQKHRRNIVDFYSEISKIQMKWLGQFLYLIFIILIISILGFYGRKLNLPVLKEIYPYHFITVVVLFYWTGYKALEQPEIFAIDSVKEKESSSDTSHNEKLANEESLHVEQDENINLTLPFKKTVLDEGLKNKLAEQLESLMKEDKIYLNSKLTIQHLSEKLNTNRQYLSEVLNGHFHKNFYEYVNDYRIEEFKRLLTQRENQHLTLLAVALEAGFHSKATFNAVFKKKTGTTPSEYYKSQL